jgi:hypothetical protein
MELPVTAAFRLPLCSGSGGPHSCLSRLWMSSMRTPVVHRSPPPLYMQVVLPRALEHAPGEDSAVVITLVFGRIQHHHDHVGILRACDHLPSKKNGAVREYRRHCTSSWGRSATDPRGGGGCVLALPLHYLHCALSHTSLTRHTSRLLPCCSHLLAAVAPTSWWLSSTPAAPPISALPPVAPTSWWLSSTPAAPPISALVSSPAGLAPCPRWRPR